MKQDIKTIMASKELAEAKARHQEATITCAFAARLLAEHDLPARLQDLEAAEAIFADPVVWAEAFGEPVDSPIYVAKRKAVDEDREFLKAALPLHALGIKLRALANK